MIKIYFYQNLLRLKFYLLKYFVIDYCFNKPVVMKVVIIILLLCSKKVAAVVAGATRLNGHEIATTNCPKYNVAKLLEDPGSTQVLCKFFS